MFVLFQVNFYWNSTYSALFRFTYLFSIINWNFSFLLQKLDGLGGKSYAKIFNKRHKKPCDEETLVNLLAEIQVINPEAIINMSTMEKVKPLCKKVSENLEKMEELLSDCEPPHQPDLYLQLIKGVEILYRKLCTDSPFRKQFEEHFSCLHKFRNEFDKCNGAPDWMEKSDAKEVCAEYKRIANCYYDVAGSHCGQEAADVMKELVISIINSILTVKCDMNEIGENPEDAIELAAGPDHVKPEKQKALPKLKGKKGDQSFAHHLASKKSLLIIPVFTKIIINMIWLYKPRIE
ncbi:uncharacterized protein LOC123313874 [Coccinella septempunctata]|uniref:uncharacterized protein LOC123313874 n=1 Tax=Coccinella septempunctata TaxID=41139 RepID=UPI001D073A8C|nr:uncharacterized protein LOC123313874 [Coccinella septempunctata]